MLASIWAVQTEKMANPSPQSHQSLAYPKVDLADCLRAIAPFLIPCLAKLRWCQCRLQRKTCTKCQATKPGLGASEQVGKKKQFLPGCFPSLTCFGGKLREERKEEKDEGAYLSSEKKYMKKQLLLWMLNASKISPKSELTQATSKKYSPPTN